MEPLVHFENKGRIGSRKTAPNKEGAAGGFAVKPLGSQSIPPKQGKAHQLKASVQKFVIREIMFSLFRYCLRVSNPPAVLGV
ncbi:hypothetical protein BTE48_03605 [Oceanospirillum multiglobuliferum]|uniref:Uncharacterized protein n=1 Tax=Oceanospirillum multiglobuliferum TaxID=64969 RepID=A0A1V4T7D8_9GAMM|nr:hypothetical protein BTE48_03605 [Oceanospirillum multiglobuliferum]